MAVDPATLEALRCRSGLSIDLEGRFRHEGGLITHARTLEVLWSSLERQDDGRYLVRVGRESGYVRIEDAPYGIRGVRLEPDGIFVHLSDGSVEALAPSTLLVGADGVLRCRVKDGSHRARFTRAAQVALGPALLEDPAAGGYALELGGTLHRVGVE
jgi:uncharacterized protein